MGLGPAELLVVLAIVLVVFGADRLPKVARSLGAAAREFRAGQAEGAAPDEDRPPTAA